MNAVVMHAAGGPDVLRVEQVAEPLPTGGESLVGVTFAGLNFDDLMALAGRFGEKAERYLRRTPEAGKLFRKISEKNLSDSEIRELSEKADEFDDEKEGSP